MTASQAKKILVSQADNFAGNFGEVLRSSAIFWVKNSKQLKTTISFSNYWKFKNSTNVFILLNLRKLNGDLVTRKVIDFDTKAVCNFSPPDNFEGSVEVEAFSNKNMRIPYAAIMAVYESSDSISMVHSYARAYSQHEIEDNRTISVGEESCWTLRDTDELTSFAVIHNGPNKQEGQLVELAIRNSESKELVHQFELEALLPYQTKIIEPKNYFNNLTEWLDGKAGNGRLSFNLNGGFTRMLCVVKTNDGSELQVTHSNFNYSAHDTDSITEGDLRAYMRTPNVDPGFEQEIVVYPDTNKGDYNSTSNEVTKKFKTGEIHTIPFNTNAAQVVEFSREDNILPTRIITALRLYTPNSKLPAECSLGVVHHSRPKKNSHWMMVSSKFQSQISWVDFKEVYGGCPDDAEFLFQLYSSDNNEEVVARKKKQDLPDTSFIELNQIFNDKDLSNDFQYLFIRCSYGGLMFFSSMKKNAAITIEHSF